MRYRSYLRCKPPRDSQQQESGLNLKRREFCGAYRKQYVIEELHGEKVVRRRPGVSVKTCIKVASTAQTGGTGRLDAPEVSHPLCREASCHRHTGREMLAVPNIVSGRCSPEATEH